jgi:DNA-binding transcriptional MerR regulator
MASVHDGTRQRVAEAAPLEDKNGFMSIGQLAAVAGVSTRTIRYYEELGILPEPPRTPAGTRKYPHDWAFYLEGARALKDVGFTLEEIRLLGRLALGQRMGVRARERAAKVVADKVEHLEHKIRVLQRLRQVLYDIERGEGTSIQLHELARLLAEEAVAL